MEKLSNLMKKRPDLKSDRSQWLKIKGAGRPIRVKLVGCENATNKDYQTQKEIKGVNLLFEESGVPKKYFVPTLGGDGKFHYLIERFADIKEGTELILEFKRKKGSVQGFIDVQPAEKGEPTIDVSEPELPQKERGGIEIPDEGEIPTGEPSGDDEIPVVEDYEDAEGFDPEV